MAITSLITVRYSKFKKWLAAYDLYFAEIQVSSTPKLPKSPNLRNFCLAKIKTWLLFKVALSKMVPGVCVYPKTIWCNYFLHILIIFREVKQYHLPVGRTFGAGPGGQMSSYLFGHIPFMNG